jgi:hypothetical protein
VSNKDLRVKRDQLKILRDENFQFGSYYLLPSGDPGQYIAIEGLSPSRASRVLDEFDPHWYHLSIVNKLKDSFMEAYPQIGPEFVEDLAPEIAQRLNKVAQDKGKRVHEALEEPEQMYMLDEMETLVYQQILKALNKLNIEEFIYPELFMFGHLNTQDGKNKIPIICFADLVTKDLDGNWRLIDFKTKMKYNCAKPSKENYLIQALFNAVCFKNLFGVSLPKGMDFIVGTPEKYWIFNFTIEELQEFATKSGVIRKIEEQFTPEYADAVSNLLG